VVAASVAGRALLTEDRRRKDAWLSRRLRGLDADDIAVLAAAGPVLEKLSRA
jgi:hypothetical protein